MGVDKIVNYTQHLLRVPALNKYNTVLAECKESAQGVDGDQWTLGLAKDVTMEQLWTWVKIYGFDVSGGV